jgi:PAS domain S-box-containing protein
MKSPRAEWRSGDDDTDAAREVQSLRRTLRDVVALSALPSIWIDYDLPRTLQNLTDVLRAALRAYTVCVRVKLPDGTDFGTVASSGLSTGAHPLCNTAELLEAVEEDSTELFEIAKFNGSGPLNALPHPLFFGGERIGHFVACYKVDVIPSQSDRLLLQVAANQVTLLFQRYKDQERAEKALAAKVRQQRAVAELGLLALRENNLQVLFARAVAEIARTLEVEYCKVLELLPGGDAVLLRAGVGWNDGLVGSASVSTGKESQAGYTLACSEPVVVKDLRTETRFNGPPLLHDHGVVSGLSCIIVGDGGPWGVLGAHTKSFREFTEDDVAFLQAVANVLATSIQRERAEQALRLSSRLPAENPAPVLRVSRDKRLHFANPKAQEFLSEWQVRVGDPMPAAILDLIGGGERHDAEITMGERCYSVAVAPVLNGEFINLYFTDITDRKRTEQKLRETNERLKKVLEVETVGVMFWDLTTGCLVDANDTFLNTMGYSRADVESRTLTWEKFTPPEYRDISRAEIAKFARTGRVGPYEKEYFHKDGTRQWLLFAGSSLDNNQVVEFCVDISERKRVEESAARLAAIVEHSDDAIFSTDLDGAITSWNRGAERLYGYTEAEAIGKSLTMLVPAGRADEEPAIIQRIRNGESVENYETERRRKDGTVIDVSLTVSPVKDAAGKIIGASKVARDITDKVRAKEKLEQTVAERTARLRDTVAELEAFSYSVAHDLRAPLRTMNSYSRLLEEDFANVLPPEARNFTKRIAAGASRLDSLITDVLNYSKIARGEMTLETVDVEKLTRDIVDSYPSLGETNATILIQSSIPPVVGNTAALTQCISNLLSNAIKFVAPDTTPRVVIRAEKKSDYIRLWFEDNGIGISEEGRQRIFRMFQRLNPATDFDGTGIGLTIVRKAVERMNGRVGVESQPGVGSQFWIELKRAA